MSIDMIVAGVLLVVAVTVALSEWRARRETQLHRDIEGANRHQCSVAAYRAIRKEAHR